MQQPQELSTLLYRVETVEREVVQLKSQLSLYEPARESELKLQSIKDTVGRIEAELGKVKDKLETMNAHMIAQETEAQKRDVATRETLSKLQIRVLWGVVSTVIIILTGVLVGYITHLFH